MNKIKLLHCADLHLGSDGSLIPERAGERKVELLGTFRKITNLCAEEAVDVLLIAGDLFEGSNVGVETVASVKAYLGEIPTWVFIAPGNHDYVGLDSPYLDKDWPDNVKIFKGGLERVDLPDKAAVVYGAGFESTYVKRSLLDFPEDVDGTKLNLCVVHGEVVSEGGESNYHGITPGILAGSQMDYVALGHIHKRTELQTIGGTTYAYPGCPDGRGFDETGEKGVYLGEIRKGAVDLHFRKMSSRLYLRERIDVSGAISELQAERLILKYLQDKYGGGFDEHYYKITVTGEVPRETFLPWENIRGALAQQLHYVQIHDDTRIQVDYEELAQENSLKGIFLRRMLDKISGATKGDDSGSAACLQKALEFGLRAFDGEVRLSDY